jgi:hypothetical protein
MNDVPFYGLYVWRVDENGLETETLIDIRSVTPGQVVEYRFEVLPGEERLPKTYRVYARSTFCGDSESAYATFGPMYQGPPGCATTFVGGRKPATAYVGPGRCEG